MPNESKSLFKKSLVSGVVLIAAAIAVAVAAFARIISGEAANVILPVLVAGTVTYNLFLVAAKSQKKK